MLVCSLPNFALSGSGNTDSEDPPPSCEVVQNLRFTTNGCRKPTHPPLLLLLLQAEWQRSQLVSLLLWCQNGSRDGAIWRNAWKETKKKGGKYGWIIPQSNLHFRRKFCASYHCELQSLLQWSRPTVVRSRPCVLGKRPKLSCPSFGQALWPLMFFFVVLKTSRKVRYHFEQETNRLDVRTLDSRKEVRFFICYYT